MTVNLSLFAGAGWQFFDNSGNPLVGGLLYTYAAGTTTPLTTYTTNIANVNNANPIILNSAGRLDNEIWLTQGAVYKFILKDSNNVLIGTYDNISGANDATALNTFITTLAGPTGASLVGYNEGDTGAVTRTSQSKFQEIISVKDFGAVGDGVTNDTTACQNAWNAVKNANGGTLYFPAGTYLCNIIGAGSDNVNIIGDGSASIVNSYVSNNFAIFLDTGFPENGIHIENISFTDVTLNKTKHGLYVNIGGGLMLTNVSFKGLGIGICTNGTEFLTFTTCAFTNCYVGFFNTCSTGSNTSILNINGQTVTITNAFFPQHPGLHSYYDCFWSICNVGYYFEQPDNPFQTSAGLHFFGGGFLGISGCAVYLTSFDVQPATFHATWFENTLSTPAVIRSLTLPTVNIYSANGNVNINDIYIEKVNINGSTICHMTNCYYGGSITANNFSAFYGTNLWGDEINANFYVNYARNFRSGRPFSFLTTPKTNLSRAFSNNLKISNDCFAASPLLVAYGSTVTRSVADSVFFTQECNQVVANTTNGVNLGSYTQNASKIYVQTISIKSLGSAFNLLIVGLAAGAISINVDTYFKTFGYIGSTPASSTTENPQLLNQTGITQTFLVSGWQVLEFDNYDQANQFLASDTFNLA
jgi:hypothetical protein